MLKTKRPLRSLLLAVPAIGLLAAACGAAGANEDASTNDAPATGAPPTAEQTASTDETVVVRLETGGGFVSVHHNLRAVPDVTITADGTIHAPGPIPAIYPGPAVTPIMVGELDDEQLASVMNLLDELGLDGRTDFGFPADIADAPTTTLDVVTDDGPISLSAYALGIDGATNDQLTAAQRDARAALSSLVETIHDLAAAATTEPLVPDGYRLWAGPYDDLVGSGGDVAVEPVDWPLDDELGGVGDDTRLTCSIVDGADADVLRDVIAGANEITRWTASDGSTFALAASPLFPGVEPCPVAQNDAVVRVVEAGGLAPVVAAIGTVASVTIDENHTIYAPLEADEPFPGPVVTPVAAGHVGDDEVAAVLERARELGLTDEELDFGLPNATDLPTTTVTIDVGDRVVTQAAYALGFEDGADLSDEQTANREALRTYIGELEALAAERATAPHAPSAYALHAIGAGAEQGDAVIDWPLPFDPTIDPTSVIRSCVEVSGRSARVLGPLLAAADADSPWVLDDGTVFTLVGRPLLTAADDGCPPIDDVG